MNPIYHIIPSIPLILVITAMIIDYQVISRIVIKKANELFEKQEYEKCFFVLNQHLHRLREKRIIFPIQLIKLNYAIQANYKDEKIETLKKIKINFRQEKYVYFYLQLMIRLFCIGDEEGIKAAQIDFPAKAIKKFDKKLKSVVLLLLYLKDDFEGKRVNVNDVLPLLNDFGKDELMFAYFLIYKICEMDDKEIYLQTARTYAKGSYIDALLNRLVKEKAK